METMDSKEILETESSIMDQGSMYTTPMALRCAIQLGIPDVISSTDTPIIHSELLSQLSIPPTKSPHLYRLMRLLVHNGLFTMKKDIHGQEGYVSTPLSKALSKKTPGNLSTMVLLMTDPIVITPCLSMAEWFQNSTYSPSPFDGMNGMSLYKYMEMHPNLNAKYNAGMASSSEMVIKAVLKDMKPMLEGFETLVDVGGGSGVVAKAIFEAAPHLKCTVYDLQQVISDAKHTDGIKFVAGDMFESVPSADIIHLKSVLMDWSNEECLKILKRCREAISRNSNAGGKVIIVDSVIDATKTDIGTMQSQARFDVFSMSVVSGKVERTEMEWKELFMAAGFTSYNITRAFRFHSIIQVYP